MKNRTKDMKQYCAEPEIDPFESFYWASDVYGDYMASCKVPEIEEHSNDPGDLLETIDNIDLPAHRLTNRVRCQYLNFLKKLLENNFEAWSNTVAKFEAVTFTPDEVEKCAEIIEMKAVQSCMIVSLYRTYILKVISQIRKETRESNLFSSLKGMKFMPKLFKKETCDVSVQTEPNNLMVSLNGNEPVLNIESPLPDVPVMSLDEKIRNFEKKVQISKSHRQSRGKSRKISKLIERKRSRSRGQIRPNENHPRSNQFLQDETQQMAPVSSNAAKLFDMRNSTKPNDSADDKIMRELEAMFETNETDNIFDSCENHVQINAIINEIERFDPPKHGEQQEIISSNQHSVLDVEQINITNILCDVDVTNKNATEKQVDLRKSLWPCEFHMQKMKLRELLTNIAEKDFPKYERIRARFLVLFGGDEAEDDELLGPYSPSIDLDEVLISSCRQRIAKWVVKSLMQPLDDGMIGNKFIFKKLAKHLADSIIYLNQYPDQRFIRKYIAEYFCSHPSVLSVEDM
ncbi:uncharacterized protein LOC129777503 [Toxorhynchites rutilus septentrionalis]|uniref:uncharacterized protein LOC129777503 n=1 Tax=Toxorhynchites rutilus septentrionalis TaxID=329112 RepID=UPI0024785C27|nr:uncharacterized protein LOC129777503 [Toxorhynchites rutilus septentrionalis]